MDAAQYLKRQGWQGDGHPLSHTGNGISRPLLISKKVDVLGVGLNKHAAVSDQWWMRAFDQGLKDLGTGKKTALATVREKGVFLGGLYGRFVKGTGVPGTFDEADEREGEMGDKKRKRELKAAAGEEEGGTETLDVAREIAEPAKKRKKESSKKRKSEVVSDEQPTAVAETTDLSPLDMLAQELEVDASEGKPKKKKNSKKSETELVEDQDEAAAAAAATEKKKKTKKSKKPIDTTPSTETADADTGTAFIIDTTGDSTLPTALAAAPTSAPLTAASDIKSPFATVIDSEGVLRYTCNPSVPVPLDPAIWLGIKPKLLPKTVRKARQKFMEQKREARKEKRKAVAAAAWAAGERPEKKKGKGGKAGKPKKKKKDKVSKKEMKGTGARAGNKKFKRAMPKMRGLGGNKAKSGGGGGGE